MKWVVPPEDVQRLVRQWEAADRRDKPKPPLFVLYADLKEDDAIKSWLVHNMLGCGEMSATYGPPGGGKGVGVEDLGLHIAAGRPWHGRPVTRGAVVYVALERKKLVERRAIAFRKKHGLPDLPFAIVGGIFDFRNRATAKQIADICKQVEEQTGETVVLVIIDTVSRALAGGDENSPKDMGAIVTTSALLQEQTEAHVMWVHHIPHESDRLRGHGALLGAVDTTVSVTRSGKVRTMTVVKTNDSDEGENVSFIIESVEIGTDGTTAPIAVPSKAAAKADDGQPDLTKNQRTLFGMLHEAGARGLTVEDWNAQARDAGIGVKRKADLNDIRRALKSKGIARQLGERWVVNHS
jgi:hypothetical protein